MTPLTPKFLLSLPSLPARWTPLQNASEQFSMYLGHHHLLGHKGLGGNVGASSTLLPSLPSPCFCHCPHSHLTEPCSQCPMNSLVCIWVPHHLWGRGARGQHGSKLKLAPLTPRSLPLLPSPCCHLPFTPSWLDLTPNVQWTAYYVLGSPTTSGGQGARGQHGNKLKLAPLTPRSLPLAPILLQLTPNGHVCVGVYTNSGV